MGNPFLFEEVLQKHPSLRLYVMHAGYPMLQEMIAILLTYPNVYVDIAYLEEHAGGPKYIRSLFEAGFENRIMYGSDQMAWPERFQSSIDKINAMAFLTEKQKRKIFYDNAVRFFKLDESKLK